MQFYVTYHFDFCNYGGVRQRRVLEIFEDGRRINVVDLRSAASSAEIRKIIRKRFGIDEPKFFTCAEYFEICSNGNRGG